MSVKRSDPLFYLRPQVEGTIGRMRCYFKSRESGLFRPVNVLIFLAGATACSAVYTKEAISAGKPAPNVVTTDKLSYRRGQPILVTIRNHLSSVIYALSDQTDCSIVSVQRLKAGHWETLGACPTKGLVSVVLIAPKSQITGTLGPQTSGVQGPTVSLPTKPEMMDRDLRTLPPQKPWQPGDPVSEVPQALSPPKFESLRPSALESEIAPGRYRIEFSFTVGSTSGPVQSVYSQEFVIID